MVASKSRGLEETLRKRSGYTGDLDTFQINPENQRTESWGFNRSSNISRIVELLSSEEWRYIHQDDLEYIFDNLGDPEDSTSMAWLASSIAEIGVQEAIRGYNKNGKTIVTEGNRRLLAARIATLKDPDGIPISLKLDLEPTGSNELDYYRRQLVANKGVRQTPQEEGRILQGMLAKGGFSTPEELFNSPYLKGTGLSLVQVKARLALLELPVPIQKHIAEGSISPTLAIREANKAFDTEELVEIIDEAVSNVKESGFKKVAEIDIAVVKEKKQKQKQTPVPEFKSDDNTPTETRTVETATFKFQPKEYVNPELTEAAEVLEKRRREAIDNITVLINMPELSVAFLEKKAAEIERMWKRVNKD